MQSNKLKFLRNLKHFMIVNSLFKLGKSLIHQTKPNQLHNILIIKNSQGLFTLTVFKP